MACQGFLVREACVSVLVCGDGFLLSGVQWSALNEFCNGVYVLGVTLGSLYVDTQGYVPALLENLRGMSCSGASWLLGGGWFWCRYGGFWMDCFSLMFCVVRNFMVFSGLVLKSPTSGFQFYSTNSLKTFPTMQH